LLLPVPDGAGPEGGVSAAGSGDGGAGGSGCGFKVGFGARFGWGLGFGLYADFFFFVAGFLVCFTAFFFLRAGAAFLFFADFRLAFAFFAMIDLPIFATKLDCPAEADACPP